MKQFIPSFSRSFSLVAAVLLLASCVRLSNPPSTDLYRIPWPNEKHEYELHNVEVKTMTDVDHLSGLAAKIMIDPFVKDGLLQSDPPATRFVRNQDGVNIPVDYDSLQAVSVYAHIERLKELDEQVGAAESVHYPVKIGLQANVTDKGDSIVNNALFDGKLDALLIVPYRDSGLPISMNAGILGHEHFHKIFQTAVLDQIPKEPDENGSSGSAHVGACNWADQSDNHEEPLKVESELTPEQKTIAALAPKSTFNYFLLRALNEGLADFWGWVYSGDETYIGHSLPATESEARRLDSLLIPIPTGEVLRLQIMDMRTQSVVSQQVRFKRAYRLGSVFARFLREVARNYGDGTDSVEARRIIAKALIQSLPKISQALQSTISADYISPNIWVTPVFDALPSSNEKLCSLLNSVVTGDATWVAPRACPEAGKSPTPSPTPAVAEPTSEDKPLKTLSTLTNSNVRSEPSKKTKATKAAVSKRLKTKSTSAKAAKKASLS